jgi:hypothetical protein
MGLGVMAHRVIRGGGCSVHSEEAGFGQDPILPVHVSTYSLSQAVYPAFSARQWNRDGMDSIVSF